MNRRDFIFNAAAGLFVAAAPPIIFDMGKNLSKRNEYEYIEGWAAATDFHLDLWRYYLMTPRRAFTIRMRLSSKELV